MNINFELHKNTQRINNLFSSINETERSKKMNIQFIKPERKVNKVFIHCSASDKTEHDDISVIREWHLNRGWRDVGYHYFIQKSGNIQNGRNLEWIPAAQKGNNLYTIAICLHGLDKEKFTLSQFYSLNLLCKKIDSVYNNITFHGHCEVSNKSCPVFDYKKVLSLDENGFMKEKKL